MGLEEVGQTNRAFARDVLTVEISGPTRPQLTLVDLPGLIHSANRMQSDEDVSLIQELVLDYMRNPRTIILAVITARTTTPTRSSLSTVKRSIRPDVAPSASSRNQIH
jgi:hypothetical protein